MITSPDNPKVKSARALLERRGREQQGQCLAEGVRLVGDALRAGLVPALIFFSAQAHASPPARLLLANARAAGVPLCELSTPVFGTLTDTVTSQGVIAVLPIVRHTAPPASGLLVVLDQLRDPGNLGTLLRSAEAAGAEAVVLAPGCVDLWNPKVLRAAMGAHFRMPVWEADSWISIAALLAGRSAWLADMHGTLPYDQVDWTVPSAIIIGSEATGLSANSRSVGAGAVAIPMAGEAESLNAAMAATVVLFEAARQRRAHSRSAAAHEIPREPDCTKR